MAKRISPQQLLELLKSYESGSTIDELSKKYNFTKLTISRNLKKNLGDNKYQELFELNKSLRPSSKSREINISDRNSKEKLTKKITIAGKKNNQTNKEFLSSTTFIEIPPMDCQIDNLQQKDFSSVAISEVKFPKVVYMIVDKKIELEAKLLKDYPQWQFLAENELNKKTIEIYYDLQIAKRFCNKEQKVIKVPNTDLFRIVAPILVDRGISRIVTSDKLIAL